ncbi:hypothetical protein GCM10011534_08110 [Pseudooceanicola nanhaiensis]|uniref:Uncharacterized protein n=1 Tax=Pseudooceanicola nanhaiensis TaxID=375761 RepID=A0A917WAE4_9RHOB|nr:hypothetical protein GCM10011534_08110 [Pseudooceanicola nanhaiensis]
MKLRQSAVRIIVPVLRKRKKTIHASPSGPARLALAALSLGTVLDMVRGRCAGGPGTGRQLSIHHL